MPKRVRNAMVNQASQNAAPPQWGATMTHGWPVAAIALCSEAARQRHSNVELFAGKRFHKGKVLHTHTNARFPRSTVGPPPPPSARC